MKRIAKLGALAVILAGGTVAAHEGHAHKIMGVVTAVDRAHVEVRTRGGEMLFIAVTPETVVRRDKRKTAFGQVHVGRRVVINIGSGEDPLIARDIQVGVMDPTANSR